MSEYPVHIEIEPRVHLIRGSDRARFPEANSLLIDDEILTLVDAGTNYDNIHSTLKDLGHEITDIDRIVLTHFHLDHKGFAGVLSKKANCEVLCHPLAEEGVKTFSGMAEYYGITSHRFYNDWKSFIVKMRPHLLDDYSVTGHFEHNKGIDCGEIELIPIHTPGHTRDHTVIGINGTETLMLVDIDLTKFGPWYGNSVSEISAFKQSILNVIDLEPKTGISSHLIEPASENLIERLENYLAVFDQREEKILKHVSQGVDTIEKLSNMPTIYPRIPRNVYLVFEEMMLQMHVEDMEERKIISLSNETISIEK
ncbi:MAG: MBL fold metallo-hydrolase [Candidatus Thorarchaeota archaeon]